jgi:hypothetical protein
MPGIGDLADPPGDGPAGGGYPGIDRQAERSGLDNRPVGGGATGGFTDILNGLDR